MPICELQKLSNIRLIYISVIMPEFQTATLIKDPNLSENK